MRYNTFMTITVPTSSKREVIDITDKIAREIAGLTGVVTIFSLHSTTAVTTANLDPGTDQDLLAALDAMLPHLPWQHAHNPAHAPDHLLASIVGPSLSVPVRSGQLQLGRWQRVVLVELNGPQERRIEIAIMASNSPDPNFVL
jgi:secondary thiamine-phosphate synthase enzyme